MQTPSMEDFVNGRCFGSIRAPAEEPRGDVTCHCTREGLLPLVLGAER